MSPHEQLRFLVGGKGVDYIIYWRVVEEQRYVDDVSLVGKKSNYDLDTSLERELQSYPWIVDV
jgi:hypothetical protein